VLWVEHAFSEILRRRRCEELSLEPRRYELPPLERFERFVIEVSGLPTPVDVDSYPRNPNIRGIWLDDGRYQIKGLLHFSGEIILRTSDAEWWIYWNGGEVVGRPRLKQTESAQARFERMQKLWCQRITDPAACSWFQTYPTGCARVLILLEMGAIVSGPLPSARALDRGDYLLSLERCWPTMAAWVGALGCDRSSGRLPEGSRQSLEIGLVRLPPPIL
jgi:hypothetical protein